MKYTTDSSLLEALAPYQFIIFDLDGTLYDEELYLFQGYRAIASYLSQAYKVDSKAVEQFLITTFKTDGRVHLFNRLCKEFSIPDTAIDTMLLLLRSNPSTASIDLYDRMKLLLQNLLASHKKLFVVTNGHATQQQNKINAIRWQGLDANIVFILAALYEPKPAPAAFEYLIEKYQVQAAKSIYIGDSGTDALFAQNCGMAFIHVASILQ